MPTTDELIQRLKEIADGNVQETRSKRVQLLMTPSMFDALKALSTETGLSVNKIVELALVEYLNK